MFGFIHTVLLLLDLSVAFESVDHNILTERLKKLDAGLVLSCFCSYVSGRSFSLEIGSFQSSSVPFDYGVPQAYVLGPLLFSIYTLLLGPITN